MSMMMSQLLKFVNPTKTKKSKYLRKGIIIFFSNEKVHPLFIIKA